ncbi:isochorismate synthase [Aquibacillus salsiterrae]|uniref:Isochorismate synthase MenF n=1 Tax=Aquibacillus salsiterrae TaxID=2950439 RepID=A0A9X4AHG2_9BACI|nr:isochorismate synthase [Aquibacillus salsiterrae]MDC3418285.1 isochorismate synthase [Aquibacillus salsiterrae]
MIQTEVKGLEEALNHAIAVAKQKKKPQLLSFTYSVEKIDPVLFFENGQTIDVNRIFWTSTTDEFCIAGIGEAYTLVSNERRFDSIEQSWKLMLDNTLTFNPFQTAGTGPIVFGGFSFDPKKRKTDLWEHYADSMFRVPSFLLTNYNGFSYLTVNVLVRPEDHAGQLHHDFMNKKSLLFKGNSDMLNRNNTKILSKHEVNPDSWKKLVSKATNEIKVGYASKIVLAREMNVTFDSPVNIGAILRDLMRIQTNSYIFAFENGQDCFLGASPERLVKVDHQQLLSTCLAGTAPRGKTNEEDKQIGRQLLNDTKNREEHDFVVKMIKDAVLEYCEQIEVPEQPVLYPLKNLQHLYTPVKAKLKNDFTLFQVVKKLHPTPALGGFPQGKSLEFIRNYEELDRGWYGAPIGWVDAYQNGEFAVAIRSALIKQKTKATLFAGCGVVKESDPQSEYEETNIKFAPMLSVLGGEV